MFKIRISNNYQIISIKLKNTNDFIYYYIKNEIKLSKI